MSGAIFAWDMSFHSQTAEIYFQRGTTSLPRTPHAPRLPDSYVSEWALSIKRVECGHLDHPAICAVHLLASLSLLDRRQPPSAPAAGNGLAT